MKRWLAGFLCLPTLLAQTTPPEAGANGTAGTTIDREVTELFGSFCRDYSCIADLNSSAPLSAAAYGVNCNSAKDNTGEMQTAINAAAAARRRLLLPGGICFVSSLTWPSGLFLQGQGQGMTVIKRKANTGQPGAPFIRNSDQTRGNSGIVIKDLDIDGNSSNQSATGVYLVQLGKVTNIVLEDSSFLHATEGAIDAFAVTNLSIRRSRFSGWATGNHYAVAINANNGSSSNVEFVENDCEGSSSNAGCLTINATPSTGTFSAFRAIGNRVQVGSHATEQTIGFQFYSTSAGDAIRNVLLLANTIHCRSSPHGSMGVSLGGGPGVSHAIVAGNEITGCNYNAVEVIGSDIAVVQNRITDSGGIAWAVAGTTGGTIVSNVAIRNNKILRTVPTIRDPAIGLYSADNGARGTTMQGGSVSGNLIRFSSLTGTSLSPGIRLQVNGGQSSIKQIDISQNRVYGGGQSRVAGIVLEKDAGTLSHTRLVANYVENFQHAYDHRGDDHTLRYRNTYGEGVLQALSGTPGEHFTNRDHETASDSPLPTLSSPSPLNGYGAGIIQLTSDQGNATKLSDSPTPPRTAPPVFSDTCTAKDVLADSDDVYVCTDSNHWRRVTLLRF